MADSGFFNEFIIEVAELINTHFTDGAVLEVKHLRRVAGIPSRDRSRIIFLSRALSRLSELGYLEYIGGNSPKRYRKNAPIPLDLLKEKIQD